MAKFFVSYARSIKPKVQAIVDLLRAAEHEVWWDHDIPGIADWWATILDHIEWCEVFVFMVSEKSVQSPYCLTELAYAVARNRPVLPFLMDDITRYTLPPEVTPIRNQWFEYTGDPAQVLTSITASLRVLTLPPKDRYAARPPEPNTGAGSIVKEFHQAVELAQNGHFAEAIRHFRNVGSLDSRDWGEECDGWIGCLQLYETIAELVAHQTTFRRAQKRWNEYLRQTSALEIVFDPFNIARQIEPQHPNPPVGATRASPHACQVKQENVEM